MKDIALQDIDISRLPLLGIYELRNLGRTIGVLHPTTYSREELIDAIKRQFENGNWKNSKAAVRGRKPRNSNFDLTKLVSGGPSYLLSVLNDDEYMHKVRNGESGTEKRSVSGFVHLLSKGGAIVAGIDLNGYGLPMKTVSAYKLTMGDFVEGAAVFSESRQAFIISDIYTINNTEQNPKNIGTRTQTLHYDYMQGVRPSVECTVNGMTFKRGSRILIPTVQPFDRIGDIAKCIHPDFYSVAVLTDETDESAEFLKAAGIGDVYLSKVDYNLKKQIIACLLAVFRAKQLAESGKDVVLFVDSLSKIFKIYNNAAYPNGRIIPGEVVLKPLADLKLYYMSARDLKAEGSLTIAAYIDTPKNAVEEYVMNEFADISNLIIKK